MNQSPFTNIFSQLSRYSCKPKARQLENFCTELLAWYVTNSTSFRSQFLELLLPGKLSEEQRKESVDADTQQRFLLEEGKPGEREVIPDLVITPANGSTEFCIFVESKVEAAFGKDKSGNEEDDDGQLEKYEQALRQEESYEIRQLVALTKYEPDDADIPKDTRKVLWSQVYRLLEEIHEENAALGVIRDQFKDFLKENNMKRLELNKIDTKTLPDQLTGVTILLQLEETLDKAREYKQLKEIFKRKKLERENGADWIDTGVYNADESLWIGIRYYKSDGSVVLLVSRKVQGNYAHWQPEDPRLKALLAKKPTAPNGVTYFDFEKPIVPDFDGKPEAIVDWFVETTLAVKEEKVT